MVVVTRNCSHSVLFVATSCCWCRDYSRMTIFFFLLPVVYVRAVSVVRKSVFFFSTPLLSLDRKRLALFLCWWSGPAQVPRTARSHANPHSPPIHLRMDGPDLVHLPLFEKKISSTSACLFFALKPSIGKDRPARRDALRVLVLLLRSKMMILMYYKTCRIGCVVLIVLITKGYKYI